MLRHDPEHIRARGAVQLRADAPGHAAIRRSGTITSSSAAEPEPSPAGGDARPAQTRGDELAREPGASSWCRVEINPPRGVDPIWRIAAVLKLPARGVDVVNIADGPRASCADAPAGVRGSEQSGMETDPPRVPGATGSSSACVAHLLGAHELGVRNLVIITGDPPKMGDYPDATAVYDVDSIGLLRMARRASTAASIPGQSQLASRPSFVLATGAEPGAPTTSASSVVSRSKKVAGAEIVMTQPVYDRAARASSSTTSRRSGCR